MAHILPESPPQKNMPKEVVRVFQSLKSLDDSYFVWHHLAPWQPDAPDFLVINQQRKVLLIKVSSAASGQTSTAAQMLLMGEEKKQLGENENKVLQQFVKKLVLPAAQPVDTLVVFPNIQNKLVQSSRLERHTNDPHWAGKEILQSDPHLSWDQYITQPALEEEVLERLRQHFTPEIVIPPEMTVRVSVDRRTKAGLSGYLLDYDQEAAVKTDLDLPEDDQGLTNDLRLNIINGVAGSGKTLILLFRLRLLYRLYPNKKFLVLTHNRPLSHDMEARFTRLEGKTPDQIEWRTFNGWCYHHWPKDKKWIKPLNLKARERILEQIWRSTLKGTSISMRMFHNEVDWIKDQRIESLEEYLAADRRGRGFGLNADQRNKMYIALLSYQRLLESKGERDWGDIPILLMQYFEKNLVSFPQYDVILIDEAQFFAPLWMKLVQSVLKPQNSHLFIVADPTQGFLGRGASWKSLGLEARGHTHHLRHSYRTTREIMQFATLLYRTRLSSEVDEDILVPDMLNMPNGIFPLVIPLTSSQDEITRIANEVESLANQGVPRKDLLILHTDGQAASDLIQAIDKRLGKNSALDPKNTYPGNYVRVTTLNAGTGLESPIVFLAGLRQLFEEEQSLRLSDEEREGMIRDNTRKLYMAATRAGQRLVLTFSGELPEVLKQVMSA